MFGCRNFSLEMNWAQNSKSKMERKWTLFSIPLFGCAWNLLLESKGRTQFQILFGCTHDGIEFSVEFWQYLCLVDRFLSSPHPQIFCTSSWSIPRHRLSPRVENETETFRSFPKKKEMESKKRKQKRHFAEKKRKRNNHKRKWQRKWRSHFRRKWKRQGNSV
jgi:hypothetical protein